MRCSATRVLKIEPLEARHLLSFLVSVEVEAAKSEVAEEVRFDSESFLLIATALATSAQLPSSRSLAIAQGGTLPSNNLRAEGEGGSHGSESWTLGDADFSRVNDVPRTPIANPVVNTQVVHRPPARAASAPTIHGRLPTAFPHAVAPTTKRNETLPGIETTLTSDSETNQALPPFAKNYSQVAFRFDVTKVAIGWDHFKQKVKTIHDQVYRVVQRELEYLTRLAHVPEERGGTFENSLVLPVMQMLAQRPIAWHGENAFPSDASDAAVTAVVHYETRDSEQQIDDPAMLDFAGVIEEAAEPTLAHASMGEAMQVFLTFANDGPSGLDASPGWSSGYAGQLHAPAPFRSVDEKLTDDEVEASDESSSLAGCAIVCFSIGFWLARIVSKPVIRDAQVGNFEA